MSWQWAAPNRAQPFPSDLRQHCSDPISTAQIPSAFSPPGSQPRALSLPHQEVLQAPPPHSWALSSSSICLEPGSPALCAALLLCPPGQSRGEEQLHALLAVLCAVHRRVLGAFLASRAHCWLVVNHWSTVSPPGPPGPSLQSSSPAAHQVPWCPALKLCRSHCVAASQPSDVEDPPAFGLGDFWDSVWVVGCPCSPLILPSAPRPLTSAPRAPQVFRLEDSCCLFTLQGHSGAITAVYIDQVSSAGVGTRRASFLMAAEPEGPRCVWRSWRVLL